MMQEIPAPTQPLAEALPKFGANAWRWLHCPPPQAPRALGPLLVGWARHQDEVEQAQRLRHAVFGEELGARLRPGAPGLDADRFDAYCDHLLVRDARTLAVVGTYRVLPPHQARRAGGLYAETEFDLARLHHLRPRLLELGRACVHRDYRSGSVVMSLWSGLGAYLRRHRLDTMLGCTSVSIADGGHYAASLCRLLGARHLAPPALHVFARLPLPVTELRQSLAVQPPPLLKGYLRLGARICGGPAWDPDFNVADFPTLLRLADLNTRYARHFLGAGEDAAALMSCARQEDEGAKEDRHHA